MGSTRLSPAVCANSLVSCQPPYIVDMTYQTRCNILERCEKYGVTTVGSPTRPALDYVESRTRTVCFLPLPHGARERSVLLALDYSQQSEAGRQKLFEPVSS